MESSTVEQEKELAATKADARITEARTMPPARSSSRKFAIFGALLVLAAIGAYLWVHSLNRVSTDDAQVDGHIVPISPKIYGKVLEVLVDDNQQVKQGQVLVRIDPQDYQAKLDQAQAAAAVAEAALQAADLGQAAQHERPHLLRVRTDRVDALGGHVGQGLGQELVVTAMRAVDRIARTQREDGADGAAFLPDAGVGRTVDQAVRGQPEHVFLERADQAQLREGGRQPVRVGRVPVGLGHDDLGPRRRHLQVMVLRH